MNHQKVLGLVTALSLFVVFGFNMTHNASWQAPCTLGGSITGADCSTSASLSGNHASGANYAASSTYTGSNVDDRVRVKVSATVSVDGSSIGTFSQEKTCFGCNSLTASVSGNTDVCTDPSDPNTQVTISSTHEYQRTTGGGSTITKYDSANKTYMCP